MSSLSKERISIDTNVVVAFIDKQVDDDGVNRHDDVNKILTDAQRGAVDIVLATMVIAEIGKAKEKSALEYQNDLNTWVTAPYILNWNLTRQIALDSHQFICDDGLKPADAVVLSTALYSNSSCLYTYDKKLLRLSNNHTNRNGNKLPIELPSAYSGSLF